MEKKTPGKKNHQLPNEDIAIIVWKGNLTQKI